MSTTEADQAGSWPANRSAGRQAALRIAFLSSVPLKRGARPEEIADAIVFLASEKATFITGQIIRVNGGKTAA